MYGYILNGNNQNTWVQISPITSLMLYGHQAIINNNLLIIYGGNINSIITPIKNDINVSI